MTTGGPLRQVIPVARSILWAPSSEGTKRPGDIPFPVFFSQAALSAVHEHLATPARSGQGVLGFLIGDLCECPETNVSYLVIDAALRLNQAIYGDRTRDVITRLWDRVEAQLEEQKAHLIGWYHTHPPLPLSLTPHDVETHEHYFGEPWQVALLLGTDAAEPTAAFFRSGSDDEWVSKAMPFYELLAPDSIRPDGKRRSFVTWRNYRAFSSATSTPKSTPAVKPPSEPKFTPAPPPPPPRAAPSKPDDTHELKFLSAAEDMGHQAPSPRTSGSHARAAPPPPPPPPAPTPAPEDRHELKFLTAAEDTPPPAPPRRPTPPPQPRVGPPPRPPAKAPAPPAPPPPEPEAQHPLEPIWPEEFEGREAEPEAPVEPEPRRPIRRRRRRIPRKVWLTLLVLLLGASAGGAYWWFQPELPALPEWSSVTSKLSGITAAVSAAAGKVWALRSKLHRSSPQPPPKPKAMTRPPAARPPVSTPPAAPTAATPGPLPPPPAPPSLTRLDVIGDSLVTQVSNFGERAALYTRGQLPCAGLARGLADVEHRWIAYNTARRSAGVLDASHAVRDQILYAKVDSVERRFEQSGCPRP